MRFSKPRDHSVAMATDSCKAGDILARKHQDTRRRMRLNPLEHFSIVKKLGQGHMSSVFLAVECSTNGVFAVKVKNKEELRKKEAFKMAAEEKEILSMLDHPFLPSLLTDFESENHIFLAMKYCSGGDINLFRHSQPNKILSESTLRFYAAEVVLALEYLHEQGIVYRDLKPENILVQDNGHIMLTDFDLSLRLFSHVNQSVSEHESEDSYNSFSDDERSQRSTSNDGEGEGTMESHSFVGTEEYIAPEVLWCTGHSFPVDWWSLGILMYELKYGRTAFRGFSRKETFFNIMSKEPHITGSWSPLKDLIKKLLVKDPSKRLGSSMGATDVKNHVFFQGLRWEDLQFVSRPPFLPDIDTDTTLSDHEISHSAETFRAHF
eukprot:PITA_31647